MNNLRSKLIRLAYRNPHLRSDLLPLLKTAGKAPQLDMVSLSNFLLELNLWKDKTLLPSVREELQDLFSDLSTDLSGMAETLRREANARNPNHPSTYDFDSRKELFDPFAQVLRDCEAKLKEIVREADTEGFTQEEIYEHVDTAMRLPNKMNEPGKYAQVIDAVIRDSGISLEPEEIASRPKDKSRSKSRSKSGPGAKEMMESLYSGKGRNNDEAVQELQNLRRRARLYRSAGKADGLFKDLPRELKQHFFRQSNDVTLKNVKNFVMNQLEMFAEEYEEINDVMADFEKLSPKELLEGLQNIS